MKGGNAADKRQEQTSSIEVFEETKNVKLTARQQLFCDTYLANGCRNSAEAIRQVGYEGKHPYVAASVMLKRPNVKKYLHLRKTQLLKDAGIQATSILLELARIAFGDIRQLYNEDGTLMNIKDLPAEVAACLEAVETDELLDDRGNRIGVTRKVKMNSKLKALELLMRFKGLLDKDKGDSTINLNNFVVSLDLDGNKPRLLVNEQKP